VSTLFVIIRYLGFCGFTIYLFFGSSFLPGPDKLCQALYAINTWAVFLYICAADLVMILRLWAMYNRSKIILGILITSYLAEIVLSTIANIIYSNPKNFVVTVDHILELSFCSLALTPINRAVAMDVSQLVHAGVMCTLVVIQFTIRSIEMYRTTKQWRLGPFINLLVVEGIAYFFAILLWNLMSTLYIFGTISTVGPKQSVPLFLVAYIPIPTLTPRFILSIREMYARSIYGGTGHWIDSGFGLAALSSFGVSRSSIVFAGGGEREGGLGLDNEDVQRRTT